MPKRPTTPDVNHGATTIRIIQRANRTLGHVAPATVARISQRLFLRPRRFDAREWELGFERSATRVRLRSGIAVLRSGHGPLVALLHGWKGRATQFAYFAPALQAAGYAVASIDVPAHGNSRGETADPFLFAEALLSVERDLGPLHGVIGHSMGGGSAFRARDPASDCGARPGRRRYDRARPRALYGGSHHPFT